MNHVLVKSVGRLKKKKVIEETWFRRRVRDRIRRNSFCYSILFITRKLHFH